MLLQFPFFFFTTFFLFSKSWKEKHAASKPFTITAAVCVGMAKQHKFSLLESCH